MFNHATSTSKFFPFCKFRITYDTVRWHTVTECLEDNRLQDIIIQHVAKICQKTFTFGNRKCMKHCNNILCMPFNWLKTFSEFTTKLSLTWRFAKDLQILRLKTSFQLLILCLKPLGPKTYERSKKFNLVRTMQKVMEVSN